MQDALTVAVHSMQNDLARVESSSVNLANINTAAYKRSVPVTRSFAARLGSAHAGLPVALPSVAQVRDERSANLRLTGNALDLAISGSAYFEVMTPAGAAYTRKGSFRLDERSRLVTEHGHPVMGDSGEIFLTSQQPAIDAAGRLSDGEQRFGQLRLVQFSNAQAMVRLDAGLFLQGAAQPAPLDGDTRLRQGYLEDSNVDAAAEMVRLIEVMRHFEAAQKVLQGYDGMLEKAINKLGET
jgi:flagellar basal body rod protein FlgG